MTDDGQQLWWQPENQRVRNVVLKLATAHAAREPHPKLDDPTQVVTLPDGFDQMNGRDIERLFADRP
jgi:hypothetical protein